MSSERVKQVAIEIIIHGDGLKLSLVCNVKTVPN